MRSIPSSLVAAGFLLYSCGGLAASVSHQVCVFVVVSFDQCLASRSFVAAGNIER